MDCTPRVGSPAMESLLSSNGDGSVAGLTPHAGSPEDTTSAGLVETAAEEREAVEDTGCPASADSVPTSPATSPVDEQSQRAAGPAATDACGPDSRTASPHRVFTGDSAAENPISRSDSQPMVNATDPTTSITEHPTDWAAVAETPSSAPDAVYSAPALPRHLGPHRRRCERCAGVGQLLACDTCPRVFHVSCVPVPPAPDAELWSCPDCASDGGGSTRDVERGSAREEDGGNEGSAEGGGWQEEEGKEERLEDGEENIEGTNDHEKMEENEMDDWGGDDIFPEELDAELQEKCDKGEDMEEREDQKKEERMSDTGSREKYEEEGMEDNENQIRGDMEDMENQQKGVLGMEDQKTLDKRGVNYVETQEKEGGEYRKDWERREEEESMDDWEDRTFELEERMEEEDDQKEEGMHDVKEAEESMEVAEEEDTENWEREGVINDNDEKWGEYESVENWEDQEEDGKGDLED